MNGYQTLYGHLSSYSVKVGQIVEKGEKIGIMGSTGDSTGTHLHFEIIKNGTVENPLKYLNR
ncbi:Murein DD-endopeptidase MepM [compost metagenome]